MSNPADNLEGKPKSKFVPVAKATVLGVAVGFMLCVGLGYRAMHIDAHKNFVRFHPYISPETLYEPTLNEMLSIVRAHTPKDKILIIVGGNSIFNGVGQPVEKLWSNRLEDRLGDNYRVVNFAFRGAYPADGGAVVAEVLRNEYPRLIYVTNTAPTQATDPIGSSTYRFIFWEAYYNKLLVPFAPREKWIEDYLAHLSPVESSSQKDMALGMKLDAWLHFKDLWSQFGYNHIFTVWNYRMSGIPEFMRARKKYADPELDTDKTPLADRYRPKYLDAEMAIVRGFSSSYYEKDGSTGWKQIKQSWSHYKEALQASFPDQLKPHTLICLSRNSPFYLRQLPVEERQRDDLAYDQSIQMLEGLGFGAMDYGRSYTPADFLDRTHLTPAGGDKLSADVAAKIKKMSKELGF